MTANVLRTYYGDDTSETALFCENMDHFIDALNVRNTSEVERKHEIFLKPYQNIDDPRFDRLQKLERLERKH